MKEHGLLVSMPLANAMTHGFIARRAKIRESDKNWLHNVVSEQVEKLATAAGMHWMPLLLSTELDADTTGKVRALIRRNTAETASTLGAYENKRQPLFMAVWLMLADKEDCQWLMDLH